MTTVLVTSATGKVGREVIKLLLTEHKDTFKVKAAMRDVNSEKAKRARAGGAEPVPVTTEDPETLIAALEGVEKMVFISPSVFTHQDITLAWINAIQQRKAKDGDAFKLKHIVRLSFATCDDPKFLFAQWHALNEVFLKTTDIKTTFVRSSLFSQNIGAVFSHVVRATKQLQMPFGDFATSYIDTRDVARVLVHFVSAKTEDAPETYDVVGAEAVKNSDVAAAISKAIGIEVPFVSNRVEESHEQLAVLGLTEGMVESILDTLQVISDASQPTVLNTANDSYKSLIGRDPIPIAQYIQEHAVLFQPPQ